MLAVDWVDPLKLHVVIDSTDISTNLETFASGALYVPDYDLALGQHHVVITVADMAGKAVTAEATFTVSNSGGASVSNLDIADGMVLPDMAEIWTQGTRGDQTTAVTASVNFGEELAFNASGGDVGKLLPLERGTNVVVITAKRGQGDANSYALKLVRTDRYRATITSPEFGTFANGQAQQVTLYVSTKKDEGLPEETTLASVNVNGVDATPFGDPDENGNQMYAVTLSVPCDVYIWALTVYIHWADNTLDQVPLGLLEGYFITRKETRTISDRGSFTGGAGHCLTAPVWSWNGSRTDITSLFANPCTNPDTTITTATSSVNPPTARFAVTCWPCSMPRGPKRSNKSRTQTEVSSPNAPALIAINPLSARS